MSEPFDLVPEECRHLAKAAEYAIEEGQFPQIADERQEMEGYATYSIEDDKLRYYPGTNAARVDGALYEQFKARGFIRAPRQGWWGQVWSPEREDLILELVDDITEEEATPEERAEMRRARYEVYAEHAAERAEQEHEYVDQIGQRFEGGQPILVGHRSERKALKDKERLERAMQRVVDEMKRTDYWQRRARRVMAHADYLGQPAVVHRRIKKLEADLRSHERDRKEVQTALTAWNIEPMTAQAASLAANWYGNSFCFPRKVPPYESKTSSWAALRDGICTPEQAQQLETDRLERSGRWIEHIEARLAYERTFLENAGGIAADDLQIEKGCYVQSRGHWYGPVERINKSGGKIVSVTVPNPVWKSRWIVKIETITAVADKPGIDESPTYTPPAPRPWEGVEQALDEVKATQVQVNYDDDYYPTPEAVIDQMLGLAKLQPYTQTILEPSAGDGRIVDAILKREPQHCVYVCEVNWTARKVLEAKGYLYPNEPIDSLLNGNDFMDYNPEAAFDRAIMNPPFSRGQWKEHVKRAYDLLKPGGRLVSVIPNSISALEEWLNGKDWDIYPLPAGTFKESGTGVNAAILVIDKS